MSEGGERSTLPRHVARVLWMGALAIGVSLALLVGIGVRPGGAGARSVTRAVAQGQPRSWVARSFQLALVPPLQGGWAGWCVTVNENVGCGGTEYVASRPVVSEYWTAGYAPGGPGTTTGWALVTHEVAAVEIEGDRRFPTRAEPVLPDDLRAVIIELSVGAGQPQPGNQLPYPRFVPLNAAGHVIAQRPAPSASFRVSLPVTGWHAPALSPNDGVCSIGAHGLSGLAAQAGSVMTTVPSYTNSLGRPFISCANTEYVYGRASIHAAILLDAAHAGNAPAALPGMRPLRGHPGIFSAPGAEGRLLARRVPHAWLAVEGGGRGSSGSAARLAVLDHLLATVRV